MNRVWLVIFIALLLGIGCAAPRATVGKKDSRAAITGRLMSSAQGWNVGKIDAYVEPYHDSATFMAAAGPISKYEMKQRFLKKYFTGGEPNQLLTFSDLTIRSLGEGHALVTGRYLLTGGGREEQSGWYTLIWEFTEEGWKIIHDHSS